jgi:hypothetical protein
MAIQDKLWLFWKRGFAIQVAAIALTYVITLISGVSADVMTALGRSMNVMGLATIIYTIGVMPIVNGWIATKIIEQVK